MEGIVLTTVPGGEKQRVGISPVTTAARFARRTIRAPGPSTIRSGIDRLIARVATEHGLVPPHDDLDFEKLAGVVPGLVLARAGGDRVTRSNLAVNPATSRGS